MIDPFAILKKYYSREPLLFSLLLIHSEAVARKALDCALRCPEPVDTDFLFEAAMLHDIGIIGCDAPAIYCFGKEPYLRHGLIGARMLRAEGLPRHALVCERHTGSGLTADNIRAGKLPLPCRDFVPISTEERLICYADKFFSKSGDPLHEKTPGQIRASMGRHGEDALRRYLALEKDFE